MRSGRSGDPIAIFSCLRLMWPREGRNPTRGEHRMTFVRNRALGITAAAIAALLMTLAFAGTSHAAPRVVTLDGFKAPGTPAQYNKVKVVKQGSPKGKKILVLVGPFARPRPAK